jgi:hypothetical protein
VPTAAGISTAANEMDGMRDVRYFTLNLGGLYAGTLEGQDEIRLKTPVVIFKGALSPPTTTSGHFGISLPACLSIAASHLSGRALPCSMAIFFHLSAPL